ncbi:hypothetical protein JCM6882_002395, partial [Rhodosporidiobolus microsporus]
MASSSSSSSHPLDPHPPSLDTVQHQSSTASSRVHSPLHTTIDIAPSPPNEDDDGQGFASSSSASQQQEQRGYATRGYSVDSIASTTSSNSHGGGGGARASSSTLSSSDAATITPMLPHRASNTSIQLPRRGSSGSTSPEEEDEEEDDELDTAGTGRRDVRLQWDDEWSDPSDGDDDAEVDALNGDPSSLSSDGAPSPGPETPAARRERRRRERRVYGGGRHRHGSRGQEL